MNEDELIQLDLLDQIMNGISQVKISAVGIVKDKNGNIKYDKDFLENTNNPSDFNDTI
jgi:hypothetical protein